VRQNPLNSSSKTGKKKTFTPDFDAITQEKITNSDQLITVIPLYSNTKQEYSRILLLKIKDTIKSVVFSMYPEKSSTKGNFFGKILIHNLDGNFIKGFRVKDGFMVAQLIKKSTSKKSSQHSTLNRLINIDGVWFEDNEQVVIQNNYHNSYSINTIFYNWGYIFGNPEESIWDSGDGSSGSGGGEVAPAEVIEELIDDSLLDPCTKAILDKLKNLTQSDIAKIFTKLGGNSEIYTLTFEIANNNGNPASTSQTSYNCYKTVIDNDFLYGIDGTGINKPPTDLAIAAVIIHEMVHTYFFSLYDDKVNSGITNALDDFDLLYQNYVTKNYAGADDAQHTQIWISFINIMASSLQEYHTGDGANPSQFYQDIILGTLMKTNTFKDKYPEGSEEYNRIKSNYLTEKNNGSNDTNYTPKGTPCQ
jgi:hypothetical protein